MPKRKQHILTAALLAVLLAVGIGICARLILRESVHCRRNTLEYHLFVRSSTIRSFPTPQKVGEEQYYSSRRDGTRPPANGIRFESTACPEEIIRTVDSYLALKGFVAEKGDWPSRRYWRETTCLDVKIAPTDGGVTSVSAVEYRN